MVGGSDPQLSQKNVDSDRIDDVIAKVIDSNVVNDSRFKFSNLSTQEKIPRKA